MLREQFGGANGELKVAMRYVAQAFGARQPHPDMTTSWWTSPLRHSAASRSSVFTRPSKFS
jgi:Mn-containing catalase